MTDTIELVQVILGLKPYILIEFDGPDGLDVKMRVGGGLDLEDVPDLLSALAELSPADSDSDVS